MNCQHGPTAEDRNDADGSVTRPENAKAASGKTQEKASNPSWRSAGAGKGVWRGIIDTFIIAAGLSFIVFLHNFGEYMNSLEPHERSTFELVLDALSSLSFIFLAVCMYVGPFVVVAGAVLGSKGVCDKKKRPPEPPSSEPKP